MKTFLKTFFLFFIFSGVFTSCKKEVKPAPKPSVVVSVAPYKYLIDKLSQGEIECLVLVPENANPHLYEPSLKGIEQARQAKVWFRIGEAFESRVINALHIPTVDLREGVELIHDTCCSHSEHSEFDVHMWLSLNIMKAQSQKVKETLIAYFPTLRNAIEASFAQLQKEFESLDEEIKALFHKLSSKDLLVSHPAFAYFCKDFGLTQHAIEHEGKEPTLKQMSALTHLAKEKEISFILIQPQHDNKGASRIAEELHIPTFLVDPYSADYLSNLKSLAYLIYEQTSDHPS